VRLDLGQVEHVVDQAREVAGAAVDRLDVATVALRQHLVVVGVRCDDHHLAETDDQVERRAQLVTDRGGELGLDPVRLLGGPAGALQLVVDDLELVAGLVQALRQARQLGLPLAGFLGEPLGPQVARPCPLQRRVDRPGEQPVDDQAR
jgi:hypothetical protein